jgi:hypothetical protein
MSGVRNGRNVRRWAPAIVLALALASVWAGVPWAQAQARVIYMATIEPRGGAQQDKEPFPQTPLPAGEGYRKTPPDANGRWEVVDFVDVVTTSPIEFREARSVTQQVAVRYQVPADGHRRDAMR